MVNYVPIDYYNLNELTEKIEWLVANDEEAKKIMMNAMALSETLFSHEGHCEYLKEEIQQLLNLKKNEALTQEQSNKKKLILVFLFFFKIVYI